MKVPGSRKLTSWIIAFLLAAGVLGFTHHASADIVHNDDVIIIGSLNVGFDAINGKNFGFDTIILSENNLRILFEDTSSTASFPTNDWRITINDSTNGGASYFSIDDATAGRQVFRVDAGAPANSLRVDSGGDVGIGTASPVVDLHVKSGNTPTLRLEQDGSSGFTAQTWDMAGNEANFFIRDVTNGSTLPFRIRPGAPTSSIDVEGSSGDVGFGTSSPGHPIHVRRTDATLTAIKVENANAATQQVGVQLVNQSNDWRFNNTGNQMRFRHETGAQEVLVIATNRVRFFSSDLSSGHPFEVDPGNTGNGNGAHVTGGGAWTNGSSRTFKKNIEHLESDEAVQTLKGLDPVKYEYKAEPGEGYVGFIAEDVPDLVATPGRKHLAPMDIVAIVTKVVKDQQNTIEEQKKVIANLRERLDRMEGQADSQE